MEVVLVRHGETEWSRDRRHTGGTDIPLTEPGRRQAAALREVLEGRRFELVLSSPLSRALETCRLAGLGDRAEPDPDLVEWDYGEYEGMTTAAIRARRPTSATDSPPGHPSRHRFQSGRVSRILAVVRPSYSP